MGHSKKRLDVISKFMITSMLVQQWQNVLMLFNNLKHIKQKEECIRMVNKHFNTKTYFSGWFKLLFVYAFPPNVTFPLVSVANLGHQRALCSVVRLQWDLNYFYNGSSKLFLNLGKSNLLKNYSKNNLQTAQ